ncbi:SseB family protein [Actinoplanes sp. TFC3]|uniref:SseB family protein n=1 Tax=Actinoplanes sp. TFC3 TaxID=1710355 RepID=UPI000B26B99E
MTEWEPATDAEVAMRNALRADDQESYFRILAGVDLLLPVTADALAGLEPLGWGTWSTGGRTHVLAFTSPAALQGCLADYTGSARRVAYQELAETWPNLEWWLAVNPGLPIEGYLPAWFVAQLSRGDLRLPTRGPGRDATDSRIPDLQAAAMAASAAAAQDYANPGSGGPVQVAAPAVAAPSAAGFAANGPSPAESSAAGIAAAGTPAGGPPGAGHPETRPSGAGLSAAETAPRLEAVGAQAGSGAGAPGQTSGGADAHGQAGGIADRGFGAGGAEDRGFGAGGARGYRQDNYAQGQGGETQAPVGPGGLPLRTPGAVLPSGLPSRVPSTPPGMGGSGPTTSFSGFTPTGSRPSDGGPSAEPGRGTDRQDETRRPDERDDSGSDDLGQPAWDSRQTQNRQQTQNWEQGQGDQQPQTGQRAQREQQPAAAPQNSQDDQPRVTPLAAQAPATRAGAGSFSSSIASGSALDALASRSGTTAPASGPSALDALGSRSAPRPAEPLPPLQPLDGPLPTRTPMAQTPPVPSHIPTPDPASDTGPTSSETSSGLPRRQVTPPSERPSSMAAAAQALAAKGEAGASPEVPPTAADPAVTSRLTLPGPATVQTPAPRPAQPAPGPAVVPPVIPGTAGANPAAQTGPNPAPQAAEFLPANDVERDLYHASLEHSTDTYLSTLLLANVLVPVADQSRPGSSPGEPGFAFRTEEIGGERFLVVFTSRERLGDHFDEPVRTVSARFVELIRNWPDPAWAFAVNPGSVVGAKYPGQQVVALASWAVEAGLGGDGDELPLDDVAPEIDGELDALPTMMQKTVPPHQVDFYLDRGYDRVAGFVHRCAEVEHLRTPGELFAALGLVHDGSPYQEDAKEAFLLRWSAFRPSLYRIPYGGQSEQALRAMDGWVIERPPFRGNGFAPGEGRDVIAEFKVDSVRLPSGAQLWRIDADGDERIVALFDSDAPAWRRVGEQNA